MRGVDQSGNRKTRALSPQLVNAILKSRVAQAGLDLDAFSAHSLRRLPYRGCPSGRPLPEAMQQSQHRSVNQAARYYNSAERHTGKAARIIP